MAIPKKKNKFTIPPLYDTSVFADGGKTLDIFGNIKAGNSQAAIGQGLGVVQGGMQLGTQIANNLSTSGIGNEVQGTNDINRNDILGTNTSVDSKQTNVFGAAGQGAMTGAQAGQVFGPEGALIGAGVGALAGGISSIFGNEAKQQKADLAQQQWTNNLGAKDREFNQQDTRQSMANFSACGGKLFADGGNIDQTQQQLTTFDAGGTHEQNPQGGIQQGMGPNGKPNLVEQGETKHDDYIFSNRLKVTEKLVKDFKLPNGLVGKTFADASKVLSKESIERPNDPISLNGVKAQLAKLTAAQEGLKGKMAQSQQQVTQPDQQQSDQTDQTQQQPQEPQNPQANVMAQGQQQMADGGQVPNGQQPQQSQQGQGQQSAQGQQQQAQQIVQAIMQMIQQGQQPQQIIAELVKSGIPQQQATQLVQQVEQQAQQQQPQGQSQQQNPQSQQQQQSGQPQQMANGGSIQNANSQQSQQGGQGNQQAQTQQIVQSVTQMVQQGMNPQQIVQQLVKMGIPQQEATQLVQQIEQQIQGQQQSQQNQGQSQQPQDQSQNPQIPQQMAFGGYKQKSQPQAGNKMQQVLQQVLQMMAQGISQEDIETQLEKSGISADQAQQIVDSAMQKTNAQKQAVPGQQPQQQSMAQGIPGEAPQEMAFGGDMFAQGGGIHIKKSHEGRFTAYKKRTGKTTTEALHSKDPHVRQMANFARNAAGWKHAFGGDLNNTFADGGNMFATGDFLFKSDVNMKDVNDTPIVTPLSFHDQLQSQGAFEDYKNSAPEMTMAPTNSIATTQDNNNVGINDYLRYTPAITNAITGISDLMQKPEVVNYGRVSPERITAHQDYTPVDTEWMNNKMNANYAGTRDQMINNAGGNRSAAIAGLSGINQQQQNAIGESYQRAQDTNYQRRTQANQFNAGVEQQNVSAQNQAQQANLQLAIQEADMNARNRAAQRNASRNAIISGANTLGDIGRENFNQNTVLSSTGYGTDSSGRMKYQPAEGSRTNGLIYRNGNWVKE